jgi:tape measure domain-containing protein
MTSEVGSAQIAVFPTFKGFRKRTADEVDAATAEAGRRFQKGFGKAAESTGSTAGRGFKKAFQSSADGVSSAAMAGLSKDVSAASRVLSAARLKEQDAAGKVRVAEAQLAETRRKYGAESSRTVAAEERLASANRSLSAAQDVTRASSDRLKAAQNQLASATKAAEAAAGSAGGGFRNFLSGAGSAVAGVASGIRSAFGSAFSAVKSVAADAANAVSSSFKVAGAAITAVLGAALVGGFGRLSAIEDAKAKLIGLGNSAADVEVIMQNALASVKGTAFGLDEAATVAASAVAAGIKPGQELERYLKLTAGAATVAGISFSEMGSIINKVTTKGVAQMDNINQVQERGIPIMTYLAEAYGVSAEKLSEMWMRRRSRRCSRSVWAALRLLWAARRRRWRRTCWRR